MIFTLLMIPRVVSDVDELKSKRIWRAGQIKPRVPKAQAGARTMM